jgi:hypothetical protein
VRAWFSLWWSALALTPSVLAARVLSLWWSALAQVFSLLVARHFLFWREDTRVVCVSPRDRALERIARGAWLWPSWGGCV